MLICYIPMVWYAFSMLCYDMKYLIVKNDIIWYDIVWYVTPCF